MSDRELFPLKSERPDAKDLIDILAKYLKYWYLFLFGGILGLSAAYLYCLYYTVPQYSISSTILLKSDKGGSDAGGLGDFNLIKSSKNINNEIEVLYSLSLMERVVRELGLSVSYLVEGRVNDIEVYGKKVPIKIIVSKFDSTAFGKTITLHLKSANTYQLEEESGTLSLFKFGQQVHRPYGSFTVVTANSFHFTDIPVGEKVKVVFQDIKQVAKHYNQALIINPVREEASVLSISLIDPVPEKGKNIINKLIEAYNQEGIEDKNLQAASTIDFLDERLKYITTELSEVEKDVEQYKRVNELTDVSSQATQYLTQASEYNSKLADWTIKIDILESLEKYISQGNNQYKMVPSTLAIEDPTLSGLIARFNELQLERERILKNAFPNNPLVLNINEQLEDLRINIKENLRNIKGSLVITINNFKANSGRYQTKIKNVPSMERELLEINRQQSIKQNLYLYLLQKREESSLSLAANISNSRIIDPAIATDYPVSPNKQTIYLMYLLLGLAIPFAGIFLKDMLNTKVQGRLDVEQLTSAPILGELIHNNTNETLVVKTGNRSPLVEMFRLIRAKLHFAAVDRENKTMLITSCMSGEGKTFFTINLGASLALTGKKVILLDLDLRNPQLSKEVGLAKGLGIANYLIGEITSINDIVKPVENHPGLFLISSGPIPPDPAELMMSPKLAHLINELKENFDHIIIDTAPIGMVADAFCLSPLIDSTVFLVRYNFTNKKQINYIETIYRNKELSHSMIVLNDAKYEKNYRYGYGYGYGYGEIKSKKKNVLSKLLNV